MSTLDEPTLNDVIDPQEAAPRDRQEHVGAPAHLNDEELQHRAEQEREQARLDQGQRDRG